MKKYSVEVSQNGWEYTGYAHVTANNVEKTQYNTIVADGVIIEFDEEVGTVSEVK